MRTPDPTSEVADLQAAGFLLPPVLTTEHIRRALGLRSTSAIVRLHKREGLPLARVGRRYVVTRLAFQRWLDRLAEDQTPPALPRTRFSHGFRGTVVQLARDGEADC
jgi:hypothetical protein